MPEDQEVNGSTEFSLVNLPPIGSEHEFNGRRKSFDSNEHSMTQGSPQAVRTWTCRSRLIKSPSQIL
jgi:hypothetical protein